MKELETLLDMVAAGLKLTAKGIDVLALKVHELAAFQGEEQKKPKAVIKKSEKVKKEVKPASKAPAERAKKPAAKKPAKETAAEIVLGVITKNKEGIDAAGLEKATGFGRKKIQNIIFKLKKQGKIKTEKRGIYVKA
jgi:hypothetical protein